VAFQLSIIIPAHNRPRILQKTLDCIAAQTILKRGSPSTRSSARVDFLAREEQPIEVIIVSDGPDEKTAEMLTNLSWPFEIQYFAVPKSQQGVCRNRAVERARSPLVLLIGDDIFLAPDACERHMKAHERGESSMMVLGYTTWDPSLTITPLMRWMEQSGVQFGYPKLERYRSAFVPPRIQQWFTYTSNLSLPAKILYQNQFREDALLYGWEDIEWGKRLMDRGVPLFYEPDAKAYHHHAYADEEVWKRSCMLGRSAVALESLVPSLRILPRGIKKIAYAIIGLFPSYRGRHFREFLRGMRSAR